MAATAMVWSCARPRAVSAWSVFRTHAAAAWQGARVCGLSGRGQPEELIYMPAEVVAP